MSNPRASDILFRAGGSTLLRYGVPFLRSRRDLTEPDKYAFTRADVSSCATYVDADGNLRIAAANKLRFSYTDVALAGVWGSPGFLMENARTNLCLQSQNFGTTWTVTNTPTRSAAALSIGMLDLDLIGDDDAAVLELYQQTIGFTGDAVKAISIFMKAGTSVASLVRLSDTTAGADRLTASIAWAAGVPTVTMTTGTLLRTRRLASGVYRFEFQTTAVTAANTNSLRVYPATTSGLSATRTGDVYAGGVQCENALYPSSYIKTTTASVIRAEDNLYFPIGFGPQDLTVYLTAIRPAWAALDMTAASPLPYLLGIGVPSVVDALVALSGVVVANNFTVQAYSGGSSSFASAAIPAGDIAIAANVINFGTSVDARIDVGSGYGAMVTTATLAATAWSNYNRIALGCLNIPTGNAADAIITECVVARGSFTMAEMATAV